MAFVQGHCDSVACQHFQTSSLKPLGCLKLYFIRSFTGLKEPKFVELVMVIYVCTYNANLVLENLCDFLGLMFINQYKTFNETAFSHYTRDGIHLSKRGTSAYLKLLSGHLLGTSCSLGWPYVLCILIICYLSCFQLIVWFEGWIWILIVSVPDLCILFTFLQLFVPTVVSKTTKPSVVDMGKN